MELLNPAMAVKALRGGVTPAGPFSWDDYSVKARYSNVALANMQSSVALTFDGLAYAHTVAAAVTSTGFTMVAWVKSSTTALQTAVMVGEGGDNDNFTRIGIDASGNAFLGRSAPAGSEDTTVGANIDDGSWHMIGAVMTGINNVDLYVDDNAKVNDTTTVAVGSYDRTAVGRLSHSVPADYFIGLIDNVLIFSTALTAAEMAYLQTNKPSYAELVTQYAAATADCPDPANVAAAYNMNEVSGYLVDQSGNGIHLSRGTKTIAANFNGAASESLINTSASPQGTMPFTLCNWWKSSNDLTLANMVSQESSTGSNYIINYILANNAVGIKKRNGSITDTSTISSVNGNDGNWHFMSGVAKSGTSLQCFCDGNRGLENTDSNTPSTMTKFRLGCWTTAQYYTGAMQWVMVYSKALTQAEHLWLYNHRKGRSVDEMTNDPHPDNPGLPDHLWKLDELSGNRSDSIGSFTLTDTNTVGATAGFSGIAETPLVVGYSTPPPIVENRALQSDGSTGYLTNSTANFRSTDTSGSVSFWFRISQKEDNQYIFTSGDAGLSNYVGFYLFQGVPRIIRNIAGAGPVATAFGSTDLRDDGNWHHVVISSDGSNYLGWVDGAAAATGANDDGTWFGDAASRTTQSIFARSDGAIFFWGELDEFSVWSGQLDGTDAAALYNSRFGTLPDVLDGSNQLNGKQCVNWWSLSKNSAGGTGGDEVGSVTFTESGSVYDMPGIPVGQGDCRVQQLNDQSTVGNNPIKQATLSDCPWPVHTSYGYSLHFPTDTTVAMGTSAFAVSLSQTNTIFIVSTIRDLSADQVLCDGILATGEQSLQVESTGDVMKVDAGTPIQMVLGADYGNRHIWVFQASGATSKLWRSGGVGETVSGTCGAEGIDGITLGNEYGLAAGMYGEIDYYVLNDGALTLAEINAIGEQLQTETGATWSEAT